MLQGKKTYITALAMIAVGGLKVAGLDIPGFESVDPGVLISNGLGFIFVRMGIKTDTGSA